LSARRAAPRGRLRIASSVPFGRMFVAPVVAEFLVAHPDVNIELQLLDRIVDLLEEGMDVAVRISRLPDSTMVALPIGETRRVVVASPALLKAGGTPKTPQDLRGQRCVTFTGVASPTHWNLRVGRKREAVAVKSALVTNQIDAAILACVQGAGYGQFFDYHVLNEIHAGRLTRVLEKFEDEPIPASIVYPSARHLSPNVRAFTAFAQPRIRERLQALQRRV
jgi:DNA-binding transcriptional LysR family regulator